MERIDAWTLVREWACVLVLTSAVLATCAGAEPAVQPQVMVFQQEGCPNCLRMLASLEAALADHPGLVVATYEILETKDRLLLDRLAKAYGIGSPKVPVIFVGDRVVMGAGRSEELHLREAIERCAEIACPSPLAWIAGVDTRWGDLVLFAGIAALLLAVLLLTPGGA